MLPHHPSDYVGLAVVPSHAAADSVAARTPDRLDESRAYHQVFLNLSSRYEEHRRTTGEAESPALCAAAERFLRERSLVSLIAFGDRLEELDIPPFSVGRKREA